MELFQHLIASVVKTALGIQPLVYAADLSRSLNISNVNIDVRELIRLAFANLGIDIEFSGKGQYEKGVVIDMDDNVIHQHGLDAGLLRFGQTVVRITQITPLPVSPALSVDTADVKIVANKSIDELVEAEVLLALGSLR